MVGRLTKIMQTCDIFWMSLNGLAIDVEHITSGRKPRSPFSDVGTLKVTPSLIPGVDYKLNRVLKRHGGWDSVMAPSFIPSSEFYEQLLKAGYSRERFDRSRSFMIDQFAYARDALRKWKEENG